MKKILFICIFTFLLTSCASTKSVMKGWLGRTESELVSAWGAPDTSLDTRDGVRALTWEKRWGQYGQNTCRKSFTVNASGTIISYSYSGCLW